MKKPVANKKHCYRTILFLLFLPAAGCPGSKSETCSWGGVCPPGRVCHDPAEECVLPDQITACYEQEDYERCSYPGSTPETRCRNGICVVPYCGDGVLDPDEECDDGDDNNDTAPDACRTDCMQAYCGDGVVDTSEECDDGAGNSDTEPDACRMDCMQAYCGDGVIDTGEECDSGNLNGFDCTDFGYEDPTGLICTASCEFDTTGCDAVCGNGLLETGQECDDGNTEDGDGCSSNCTIEPGWYCEGEPSICSTQCGDDIAAGSEECDGEDLKGLDCTNFNFENPTGLSCTGSCEFDMSGCQAVCGNGLLEPGEECDDGSGNSDTEPDACRTDCTQAYCGDGVVDTDEECDGANLNGLSCMDFGFENPAGLSCTGSCEFDTSGCQTVCGNGLLEPGEECDDGNIQGGDGCSSVCEIEPGWYCTGIQPSTCVTDCGDGIAAGDEICDGDDLKGASCESEGFDLGVLRCAENCLGFDYSECFDHINIPTWVLIDGGQFNMGSNQGDPDETPVHAVTISQFMITKTQITVSQYEKCVLAGECEEPAGTEAGCNWNQSGFENHPINCVSFEQAHLFCKLYGGRLPSEAEWEYAARSGGQDITYPWGNETATCDYAVMNHGGIGCATGRTWDVCSKLTGNTDQGLCDMAGNVWDWVQDCYHYNYNGAPDDGSAWEYTGCPDRVRRGGSLFDDAYNLRASRRAYANPAEARWYLGFRCVK